jgi:hypothetical protein
MTDPSLIFTNDARRFLTLALLQAQDSGTINPWQGDDDAVEIVLGLHSLGLLEITRAGWRATDLLKLQPWARELVEYPFGRA